MLVQEPVESAVWHCLNHYAYNDAIFLAERYLLAKCAVQLKKDHEAEKILLCNSLDPRHEVNLDEFTSSFGDKTSFALQLLAGIYERSERRDKATEIEKKLLKLNPFLWSTFQSMCDRGEPVAPHAVFDVDNVVHNFAFSQGVNPLVNLVNASFEQVKDLMGAPDLSTAVGPQQSQLPPTTMGTPCHNNLPPHFAPHIKISTPDNYNRTCSSTSKNESGLNMNETSLGGWSTAASTPMGGGSANLTGGISSMQISGINLLNSTTDSDICFNRSSVVGSTAAGGILMPAPPMKPKMRRLKVASNTSLSGGTNHNVSIPLFGGMAPYVNGSGGGGGSPLCRTNGFTIRTLEFSASPQILMLTPTSTAASADTSNISFAPLKQKIATTPFPPKYPKLPECPLTPCSRSPTPSSGANSVITDTAASSAVVSTGGGGSSGHKRVAMANKPPANNQKQLVLGQSVGGGNLITPQNTMTTRRSLRIFGSTQSVKENSKGLEKRISTRSPTRKVKSRIARTEKQLTEIENNENKSLITDKLSAADNSSILTDHEKAAASSTTEKSKMGGRNQQHTTNATAAAPPNNRLCHDEAVRLQRSSAAGLMNLLRQLGSVYAEVARFNFKEAIRRIQGGGIPDHHARSSWVLSLLGKCYFELNEYTEAAKYFRQVREQDPYRLEMMDLYSTALWQLQDEVGLSVLAQDLVSRNKLDPVAWCATGNCFSHHKEHENAIRFFQRAVQLNNRCAYAYTLLGHEYVLTEELEKGLEAYRTAARLDPRHYNAWYGIGLIFFKQERYQLAEYYYRKALSINQLSPVLMCHLAVVQRKLNKVEKALQTLNNAIQISPKNALCKFERASILLEVERYSEALEELLQLKDIEPKQSLVYFLLGKVYNKLGNVSSAMMSFSWATDLDPKGASSQIKDVIDPSVSRMQEDSQDEGDSVMEESGIQPIIQGNTNMMDESSLAGENYSLGAGQLPVLHESDESL